MIEEFSKGPTLVRPTAKTKNTASALCLPNGSSNLFHWSDYLRLSAVDGIKGLVQEQANGPAVVDPARTILVEAWIVPQQRQEVDDDKRKAGECDGIGRH